MGQEVGRGGKGSLLPHRIKGGGSPSPFGAPQTKPLPAKKLCEAGSRNSDQRAPACKCHRGSAIMRVARSSRVSPVAAVKRCAESAPPPRRSPRLLGSPPAPLMLAPPRAALSGAPLQFPAFECPSGKEVLGRAPIRPFPGIRGSPRESAVPRKLSKLSSQQSSGSCSCCLCGLPRAPRLLMRLLPPSRSPPSAPCAVQTPHRIPSCSLLGSLFAFFRPRAPPTHLPSDRSASLFSASHLASFPFSTPPPPPPTPPPK